MIIPIPPRLNKSEKSSVSEKPKKSENPARDLIREWQKDSRSINYNIWYHLIDQWSANEFLTEVTPYNKESILHLWWFHGHCEIMQKILEKQVRMVKMKDVNYNTPFHCLCQNSTSSDTELITMFKYLKHSNWNIK